MEFMVIQRLSDGKFLKCTGGFEFVEDIRIAAMYSNEDVAQHMAKLCTARNHASQVLYVTFAISNVKG